MRLSKRLIRQAGRQAFPIHRRLPRGATGAVEAALQFCLDGRREGATGPMLYAHFMRRYFELRPACSDVFCTACETSTARAQRLILACLEAIAGLEEP
jgi:hypothetical protein